MLPCSTCKAECCYSPSLLRHEYQHFLAKFGPVLVHEVELPGGQKIWHLGLIGYKCPLLQGNQCSIYKERPEVCRKFGEVPELICPKVGSSGASAILRQRAPG